MTQEESKAQEAQRRLRANSWQIQKVDQDPPTLLLFHGAALLLDVDAGMRSLESWAGQRAEVRVQRNALALLISTPNRVLPQSTLREVKHF